VAPRLGRDRRREERSLAIPPGGASPREFRVEVVTEGALGTLFLGASKLPVARMESVMNRYGAAGWEVAFMLVERKRFALFWQREAAVITFSRVLS
jgi:hypothetical protein